LVHRPSLLVSRIRTKPWGRREGGKKKKLSWILPRLEGNSTPRNRSKTGFSPGGDPGGRAQVLDFVGGPSGTRTLGPLIKSRIKGIAQVVDKRAIPLSLLHKHRLRSLPHLVPLCRSTPHSVSLFNTYLTPNSST